MAKKETKTNDNTFALLAIVAIVAVVFMVSQAQTTNDNINEDYVYEEIPVYDEAGNLVGEARALASRKDTSKDLK